MPSVIKENFEVRSESQSSTSKYIQTKTTDEKGNDVTQNTLGGTPDDKIVIPQLKKDTNNTKQFSPDGAGGALPNLLASLATAMGVAGPLAAKTVKKEVAEPKPTGEKAEYGKIVVRENKAGFVEIRDETPGNVRKIDLHPTGTYDAMLNEGERIEKTTGKRLTMIDKDWEIVIFGDEIVVISGDTKLQIKKSHIVNINKNEEINIDKDQYLKVGNDQTIDVTNKRSKRIGGDELLTVSSNQKEKIGGNHNLDISGSSMTKVSANKSEMVMGQLTIIVSGACNISSSSVVNIVAPKINLG